jgi:type II secretory pathway pseudopilin PulG
VHKRRDGAVLLEAIVALAVLGTIASGSVLLTAESVRAVNRVHAREAGVRGAQRLLDAVSLWPREDLDRHLGSTAQGPWRLYVDRVSNTLYEVAIVDTATDARILRTAVFRHASDTW